uniref:Uncharacterized protein n=1 Tax=Arundo donax TaxID=35708 RepID=A0A0A9HNQ8_ARUDO
MLWGKNQHETARLYSVSGEKDKFYVGVLMLKCLEPTPPFRLVTYISQIVQN